MITPNFRDGGEMDHSATPDDEFRYQARGYAKHLSIVERTALAAAQRANRSSSAPAPRLATALCTREGSLGA